MTSNTDDDIGMAEMFLKELYNRKANSLEEVSEDDLIGLALTHGLLAVANAVKDLRDGQN